MPSTRRPGRRPEKLLPRAELERLLDQRNGQAARRREIDRRITQGFRRTRAVFVLDMAGFSLSVQRHGIIHHLAKIHRMRATVGAAVRECGGRIIKFEADNAFATFATVPESVCAALRINERLEAANREVPTDNAIHVAIGIGYGPILLARDDLFGDEVNLASKLGEDIAEHGEVLLTERAHVKLRGHRLEPMELSISGILLKGARLIRS